MTKEELHLLAKRFCMDRGGVAVAYEDCQGYCELYPFIGLEADSFTKSELLEALSSFCRECLAEIHNCQN